MHRERERDRPVISEVECGDTIPVFGRTQYFFGLVVFTWRKQIQEQQKKNHIFFFTRSQLTKIQCTKQKC